MATARTPAPRWCRWLEVVAALVVLFGLALVVAPGPVRLGFSMMVYGQAQHIAGFGSAAVAYVSLVHAVLGAVMVGWGVALGLVVHGAFRRGQRDAWLIVAASVLAWFVPDTAYSLLSGFWPNAVLNLGFGVLFAVPLAATYRDFHPRH